jgi:exopolysaccharide production protein ExoY
LGSIPVTRQAASRNDLGWQAVAIGERLAAVVLFAASIPVLAAGMLAVWLLSGRSPLIAHRRVGFQGAPLWMLKLRTMWNRSAEWDRSADGDAKGAAWIEYIDDDAGPGLKQALDSRVSGGFARFCRRHSIDELPQLWHVIRGEMSLVGPRPMTERELRRHYGADADEVLRVKPGIAGLWQTSGRNRLTYAERRKLDLKLVRERSLSMYVGILLRTLPEVWSGENTW